MDKQIGDLCFKVFNNLCKSGKPDPKNEYTVLAAIICEYKTDNQLSRQLPRVVAISTGTKCFPSNESHRYDMIVDSHAESLLKRAFKRHLISLLNSGFNLDDISSVSLFVSQLPCGSVQRWKGDEQQLSSGSNRKPGRGQVCRRATCLMKIRKWVFMGLQGRALIGLTGRPITIDKIFIGNCGPTEELDQKMTTNWFQLADNCVEYKPFCLKSVPKIYFCEDFRNDLFIKSDEKQSTPTSIVMWLTTDGQTVEVLTDGHRLGVTKKNILKNKPLICKSVIDKDINELDIKSDLNLCQIYEKQWIELKKSTLFKGWP